MGLFKKLFGKKNDTGSSEQYTEEAFSHTENPVDETFFEYTGQTAYRLKMARCVGGKVYCCQPYGEDGLIGYYEKDETGKLWVMNHERVPIGIIGEDCIGLTIQYLYHNERCCCDKAGIPRPKYPAETYFHAAYYHDGFIWDMQTEKLIADYRGDGDIAAAAFACMVYEVLSDTKFNHFFYDWRKNAFT